MSETDVRMEILFAGQAKEVLFTLPASDYARFEDEYAAWKISGQAGVEFQYQEAARTTFIRYDQILSRSIITVAHHRKEQADALKALSDL